MEYAKIFPFWEHLTESEKEYIDVKSESEKSEINYFPIICGVIGILVIAFFIFLGKKRKQNNDSEY